ncbi:hypothetical protein ACE6H2_025001 [Prunus campanulata]
MEMERQQTSPTVIRRRFKLNPNKDAIIDGLHITEYELNNHPSQVYFPGKIYFKDGREKGVRFFKFKESEEKLANKIVFETSKIDHKSVLKAYFAAYYELESLWILCYDWFDSLLDDVVNCFLPVRDDNDILSSWWGGGIRYSKFVEKLEKHPFLCTCKERMKSFSEIWHWLNESDTCKGKFKKLLDDGEEFQQYKNTWNDVGNMSSTFESVYNFKKKSGYKGESVWDLLRFLRNIYEHYLQYNISIEDADCEVRKLYPNFLDKLYPYIWYEGP